MPEFIRSVDGVAIAYEAHGAGRPAIVLVHGWCCNRKYWTVQVPLLARRYQVVALDLGGHGESGRNRDDWSIAAFASDVAAVVDGLRFDEVVLVGHSMGADVALKATPLLGKRVRAQIWVDQYGQLDRLMDEVAVRERMAPFRSDFEGTTRAFVHGLFAASADPLLVDRVARDMSSAPASVAVAALEATWSHGRSVPALLSRLDIPVVAINASGAENDAESLKRHGVEVITMPDVGHFPMLERPDRFTACLMQVLETVDRA